MTDMHHYGLIRFSKKAGKMDTTMTALGRGVIQLWAWQNTTKTKVTVIVDIDMQETFAEYVGTADGFPEVRKDPATFEYTLPYELWEILNEEVRNRAGAN